MMTKYDIAKTIRVHSVPVTYGGGCHGDGRCKQLRQVVVVVRCMYNIVSFTAVQT